MKTKLMIIALTFCSSLAVASDGTAPAPTASKKKLMKAPRAPDKEAQIDETVLGNGLSTAGSGGLGTVGTAAPKKSVRGTAPAPTK